MPRKVRDYKDEYAKYQGKPDQIKARAKRNAARASVAKSKGAAAIKGKDVDHKKPISKGGDNSTRNLRAISPSKNRSYARTKKGAIK